MKTLYRIETFECSDGTWRFAKLVKGKCVFFFSVPNEEKAKSLFWRIADGYDPAEDKRCHSDPNPDELYKTILEQTKGDEPTVWQWKYSEKCSF